MKKGKDKELESGFRIENLILLESNFKRVANVTFNTPDILQNIDVDVNVNVDNDMIFVTEKVHYMQKYNDVDEVDCTITMAGIFKKIGKSELQDLEQFGHVNAAAIIFPYIREHLSNLSSKAGLGLIILPPANFTKN